MTKAKFGIKKLKILTLTPKWTGWHNDSGGMISREHHHHCCLAEAMLQAGYHKRLLGVVDAAYPKDIQHYTLMGKGWQPSNAAMHTDVFVQINDFSFVTTAALKRRGIKTDGLDMDLDGDVICDTPERKIAVLRRCVHLLGYKGLTAVPPKGYKRKRGFDYAGPN